LDDILSFWNRVDLVEILKVCSFAVSLVTTQIFCPGLNGFNSGLISLLKMRCAEHHLVPICSQQ